MNSCTIQYKEWDERGTRDIEEFWAVLTLADCVQGVSTRLCLWAKPYYHQVGAREYFFHMIAVFLRDLVS